MNVNKQDAFKKCWNHQFLAWVCASGFKIGWPYVHGKLYKVFTEKVWVHLYQKYITKICLSNPSAVDKITEVV